ncbi:MAG: hypothetical protein KDD25_09905, partial [Bdellovibrionales bacterium]|nr:hypothetical protein [Bdellovibrionales bacterium]
MESEIQSSAQKLREQVKKLIMVPSLLVVLVGMIPLLAFRIDEINSIIVKSSKLVVTQIDIQTVSISEEMYFNSVDALKRRLQFISKSSDSHLKAFTSLCMTFSIGEKEYSVDDCILGESTKLTYPVFLGEEKVGSIGYEVQVTPLFWVMETSKIFILFFIGFGCLRLFQTVLLRRMQGEIVIPLLEEIARKNRAEAVVKFTKMIAHDVKRPIVLAKMAVNLIDNIGSLEQLRQMKPKLINNIEKASDEVLSMLKDITLVGMNSNQAKCH